MVSALGDELMSKSSTAHKNRIKKAKLALELVNEYLKTVIPKLKYESRLFVYKFPSHKLLIGVRLVKNISISRAEKLAKALAKLIKEVMSVKTINFNTYYLCWDV